MLSVHRLVKRFGGTEVLKEASASVGRGEILSIVGPSGSGKSTLLRCALLLDVPEAGEIAFDGTSIPLRATRDGQRVADRGSVLAMRRRTSVAFQGFHLWSHMTVLENIIEVPISVHSVRRQDAVAVADGWLKRLGIHEHRGAYPSRLSGGQQQRVALARALATKPDLLLLDEPTSALDTSAARLVADIILEVAANGAAVLLVSHDLRVVRAISTRVSIFENGRVARSGAPAELPLEAAVASHSPSSAIPEET